MLGAILLSRDVLGAVVEAGLRYDDFYKPGHQHIFDVAVAVSQSGEPVDTITVAEELARLGLLEQAGGVEALHALQNATPAISNAAAYARIVQDAALLRRLILVAADISEIGYSRPDNVDDALDDAESRVFRVADRRVVDSYRDIGELMKLAVDRIEENFARGDTITGIATGYNDLDELLSGLQPSTLNIVGARPAMAIRPAERSVKYLDGRRRVRSRSRSWTRRRCSSSATRSAFSARTRPLIVCAPSPPEAGVGFSIDTVPAEVWDDIEKAKGELSWAEISRRCGRARSDTTGTEADAGPLRRETVAELAEALDDDRLRWWASPDIAWDRIVSIEPAGEATGHRLHGARDVHNFIAADLFLHNTAFGLGMATHVAKHSGRPALVFSLEMGHVELTQRILSSEAEVDSQKIRNGRLSEADWAKIGRAIGRLEVPLFLDDNPRVTVMEIRAKARRLKMQHGDLGLILVDYLQLMSSGGYAENRQLEVSEISRNLKILARELEVPIVALSQLSRNLESRSDKHPMLSDLRESGIA